MSDTKYTINGSTMTDIASAVRAMRHEKQLMTPAQIEAKIRASRLGIPITVSTHINPATGQWERPIDWPDIDALSAQIVGDQDCLYLTYDLRKTPGYGWIGLYAKTADSSAWTAERGHIENGAFVADDAIQTASNDYLREPLDSENGNVQLWRVTSTGHITQIGFATNTDTNAQNYQNNMQPCVQRAGTLPWCASWFGTVSASYTHICGGTMWLERDALVPGKLATVTSVSNCWLNCYSLQSLDVSGWDTSGWAVTSLNNCWSSCYSLQSLDLSEWDTSGWAVTDTRNIFAGCIALKTLKTPATLGTTTGANNNGVPNVANLETFTGYSMYVDHSYNSALKLTPQSLVNIIDRLPTVTSAKTLTLGMNKLKLTAAQIAVATGKGWTVA